MRRGISVSLLIVWSVFFLAACHTDTELAKTGDVREATPAADVLPTFLSGKSEDVQSVYRIAAERRQMLQHIPCYCGCGESVGHQSNADCFIHTVKEDGAVVWDDHGTKCGVCLEIAVKSAQMAAEGADIKTVRQTIDAQYGTGYADPTPTPLP